jgi:hypothetical protein
VSLQAGNAKKITDTHQLSPHCFFKIGITGERIMIAFARGVTIGVVGWTMCGTAQTD